MSTSAEKVMGRTLESHTDCEPSTQARTRLNTGLPPVNYAQSGGKHVRFERQYDDSSNPIANLLAGVLVGGLAAGAYAYYQSASLTRRSSRGLSIAGWLPDGDPLTIRRRRSVKAKPEMLYAEWRKLENLPLILSHLKSVEVLDDKRSYWVAKGPAGLEVSWIAKITEDEPGRAISWRSEEEADVPNSGRITFNEKPNGDTLIEVRLTYQPPAGELGLRVAKAFGENPTNQLDEDLTRFKHAMEVRHDIES